ncbi:MAG TPA: (d)CMP kinase [Syntrophorhabdaceae bacterium]|nr:(d)CMP kinase [Syntrophorhabdaceae bacterium]HQK46617.1 (d)CMP kinase [Syntrophorhabdaceae bacterium]HRR71913.1 (d)CMP kinase [Syntrophorhabdaceae bacterium]
MKKGLIITIDGPSGAGKSTIARLMAKRLGYMYIDTGAMYRGVACAAARHNITGIDEGALEMFLGGLDLVFDFRDRTVVILDGEDISEDIRMPEISMLASRLSQNKKVRDFLTKKQREIGKDGGVILEGRDTGSVVFPDADIKFYLDAKHHERAKRRFLELSEKGVASDMERVKEEMEIRDREDSKRDIAPLTIPQGAIYIDTTGLDIDGVLEKIMGYIRERV